MLKSDELELVKNKQRSIFTINGAARIARIVLDMNHKQRARKAALVDIEIEPLLRPGLLQPLDCDFWGEETGCRLTGAEHCRVVAPNDETADLLTADSRN